jgi:hypothetical protein
MSSQCPSSIEIVLLDDLKEDLLLHCLREAGMGEGKKSLPG